MSTDAAFEALQNDDGELDKDAAQKVIDTKLGKYQAEQSDEEPEVDEEEEGAEEEQEEPSADDDSPSEPSADDGDEWTTSADIIELVRSLGYSPEDMAEFGSKEEFDRHVRLMDRSFVQRGREVSQPGDEQEAALEAQERAAETQRKRDQANEQHRENGRFARQDNELPKLDPEKYEEELITALDARDDRIARLEQEFARRDAQALQMQFDTHVDNLGHPELLGADAENLTDAQITKRTELWEEMAVLWNGMEASGKTPRMTKGLIQRAFNSKFTEEVQKENRRKTSKKAKKQAAKVTGSGTGNAKEKPWDGDPKKNPKLLAAYQAMVEENG